MDYETYNYGKIGETLHVYEHPSGLKAVLIPKKDYSKMYAAFAAHYGSINNEFIMPGESRTTKVPPGIAHFLEHKLFEQKDGSVMDKFTQLGSSPNAYTGFERTVYHFTCTDRFNENFQLLLDFVQNPYITDESVEKEKGIIGQEIDMYRDEPGWRAYFNLLGAFYKKNPVRLDIAGTQESVAKIDRETLYKCYNTFYNPSNMAVCIAGDIEPQAAFEQVRTSIKNDGKNGEIKRIFPEEDRKINTDYAEQSLTVSMPLFQMGFRDNRRDGDSRESMKHEITMKILIDLIFGRSSKLYNELYIKGLINTSFGFDYALEETYAYSLLGGESLEPLKVRDLFLEALNVIKKSGLDNACFDRIKKAHYGRFVRQLNSVERVAGAFIGVYFKGINLFDYLDLYDKITNKYAEELLLEHFNPDNLALSVIKPN